MAAISSFMRTEAGVGIRYDGVGGGISDGAEREPMVPPKPRLVAVEPSCIAGARIGRGSTSGGMLRCDMACGRCGREPSPPAARSPEPCMGGPCGGSGAPSVLSDMAKENVPSRKDETTDCFVW